MALRKHDLPMNDCIVNVMIIEINKLTNVLLIALTLTETLL